MDYMVYSVALMCIVVLILQLVRIIIDGFNNYTYKNISLVVMVDDTTEDIEIITKNMVWNSENNVNIILADAGTTDELKDICKSLEKMYDNVYFCSQDEIKKVFLQIKKS